MAIKDVIMIRIDPQKRAIVHPAEQFLSARDQNGSSFVRGHENGMAEPPAALLPSRQPPSWICAERTVSYRFYSWILQ
jgi:hypothetical protein